jgi:hypothetical protein
VWIDETGTIVRPAETAPAPPRDRAQLGAALSDDMPERFRAMLLEAQKIPDDSEPYHAALHDWVQKGSASEFALSPDEVVARSRPRSADVALGHAHFELATHLEAQGHHAAALPYFREAHRLVPESWTFRRQAWSLEAGPEGPFARFWQGPSEQDPDSWPYEGDWLSDTRAVGAENYNERFRP